MRIRTDQRGLSTVVMIAIAGVIVVGGGIAALSMRSSDSDDRTASTSTSDSKVSDTVTAKVEKTDEAYSFKNWADLRANKKPQLCTFMAKDGTSSGNMYFDGVDKGRIDFKSNKDAAVGSVYADSQNIRFVTTVDGAKRGFIYTADSLDGQKQTNTVDPNTSDVKCSSWTVDAAMLVAPADVNYVDISKLGQ